MIFSTNESKYDSIPMQNGFDGLQESFQANTKRSVEHFSIQQQCQSARSEQRSLQQNEQEIDSNTSRKKVGEVSIPYLIHLQELQELKADGELGQHSFRTKPFSGNIERSESTAISYSGIITPQPLSNHPTERKLGSDVISFFSVFSFSNG